MGADNRFKSKREDRVRSAICDSQSAAIHLRKGLPKNRKIASQTPVVFFSSNLYVESLTDRMAGIEKQDHDPGVEQQLQANRLVKEPGHGHRQKITERHTN